MVLKMKGYVDVDTNANVPVGAPKPSQVKELLLALKSRLEVQLNGNGNGHGNGAHDTAGRPNMARVADWSEVASDLHDTVVERAVQDNILRQLGQVNETLERIDEGKYGICTECLKPIAADRLVVRPNEAHGEAVRSEYKL